MPSILPGYEYDIFISYRQKDNKHDHWVTEFVNNLKGELESTFKEDISIYFDENPHDGLLETHDVDASLKEKLKCLIFIPIISRTYCDPKSFAWEHEFKAFVEMASKDQFGLKVKLPNGNIASRVLPVQIYDLDPEDNSLIESILIGHVRGIEFKYKEPGVSRPLRPQDSENMNISKTNYLNQINKTANAVREIIAGLKHNESGPVQIHRTHDVKQSKPRFNKLLIAGIFLLILVATGVFTVYRITKKSQKIETSIAVLPFTNDSQSDSTSFLIIGIEEAIRNDLQTIKSFTRVLPRTSTEHFRGAVIPSFSIVSKELGVNYVVEGNALKFGKKFQLNIKLIRVDNESQLWSKPFENEINSTTDIFKIESEIAQSIAEHLNTVITPAEDKLLKKAPTENMEALNAYLKGEFYRKNLSRDNMEIAKRYYEIALNKDPHFAAVYCSMAMLYSASVGLGYLSTSEGAAKHYEAIMMAMKLDSNLAEVHHGLAIHHFYEWKWKDYEDEILKSFRINPNIAMSHAGYSDFLIRKGRSKEGLTQIELAMKLDPIDQDIKSKYCYDLLILRRYAEAIYQGREVLKTDPENIDVKGPLAQALYLNGNRDEALMLWKSLYSKMYPKFFHAFDIGYGRSGYPGALNLEADTLAEQSKTSNVNPGDIAILYAAAENKKKALNFWEFAFREHDINMILITDPVNDCLKAEQRYQYLCRQMEMPISNK